MPELRDNDTWLRDLRAGGAPREAALADLHTLLMRALPQGLSRSLPAQSPGFESLVEDTAQETLLRVLDKLDSFEGRSQFTTWVYKIAVRIALNELRRRRWRDVSLDGLESDDDPETAPRQFPSSDPGPEHLVEQADILKRVQAILSEELTGRQRAAMLAVNVQGVSMEEVARRMGTNRNALYKLMHDARVRLKHRLEREGLSPESILEMFAQ
ncbi:MAG: RNA polymerase sigma factor [Bacteroidota bacterium]